MFDPALEPRAVLEIDADRDLRIELPERLDGERHAAEHSVGARHELAARVPVGDDRRDRRQVVERLVLVERRAHEVAKLVLMVGEAEQPHSAERGRRAERRDRARRLDDARAREAAFPCGRLR